MNRRQYLAAVAASIGLPGCATVIGSNPDSATDGTPLTVDPPTVSQGGRGTIAIAARGTTTLRVSKDSDVDARLLEYGSATFSPGPDATYQSRPPTWTWSSETDVSGEITVDVPDTIPPGSYAYTIRSGRGETAEEVTEQFTLVVES
jgi:hypothetical protein